MNWIEKVRTDRKRNSGFVRKIDQACHVVLRTVEEMIRSDQIEHTSMKATMDGYSDRSFAQFQTYYPVTYLRTRT